VIFISNEEQRQEHVISLKLYILAYNSLYVRNI